MSRTMVLMLLAVAVFLGAASCRKEGPTGAKKPAKAPSQGKMETAKAPPTAPAGQQPAGGTAQQPAGGTAQQPSAGRTQPGATAGGTEANQPAARAPTQPAPTTPASAKSQPGAKK
jgi:hypothetical protein